MGVPSRRPAREAVLPPQSALVIEVVPFQPYVDGIACVRVAPGATVADVLDLLGIVLPADVVAAVWGRPVALSQMLLAGDRVELTRPLATDPKAARRARVRQGPR